MNIPTYISLLLVLFVLNSCDNFAKERGCTDIFITEYIEVTGDTLDEFYTIRLSTNDTIRTNYIYKQEYSVLNDSYQNIIANSRDSFHFIGIIDSTIVIRTPFVFQADHCHISKVSGLEKFEF